MQVHQSETSRIIPPANTTSVQGSAACNPHTHVFRFRHNPQMCTSQGKGYSHPVVPWYGHWTQQSHCPHVCWLPCKLLSAHCNVHLGHVPPSTPPKMAPASPLSKSGCHSKQPSTDALMPPDHIQSSHAPSMPHHHPKACSIRALSTPSHHGPSTHLMCAQHAASQWPQHVLPTMALAHTLCSHASPLCCLPGCARGARY